jgi:hypothetical protein
MARATDASTGYRQWPIWIATAGSRMPSHTARSQLRSVTQSASVNAMIGACARRMPALRAA